MDFSHFSVRIPYTSCGPTVWHPDHPSSVLVRGVFSTSDDAHAWAEKNIKGHTYDVIFCPDTELVKAEVTDAAEPVAEPVGSLSDRVLGLLIPFEE